MNIENLVKGAIISLIGGLVVKGFIDRAKEYRENILEIECKEVEDEDILDEKY